MFRTFVTTVLAALAFNAFAAVDVNRAGQAELESVKGIGPGLSAKILDARKTGSFKDWTDFVDRVAGIGAGSAAKLSNQGLTVGGLAYAATAAPSQADKPAKTERRSRKAGAETARQ